MGALIALERFGNLLQESKKSDMMPYFLHLMLSYSSYASERLPRECRTVFFERLREMFFRFHITERSRIAMPGSSGGSVQKLRYLMLRLLHPLARNAILRDREKQYFMIVHFREILQGLAIKVQTHFK